MTFLIKRTLMTFVYIVAVVLVNFVLFYASPGDPTSQYFGPRVSKTRMEKLRAEMGYDRSAAGQFKIWAANVCRGNLGFSWSEHRPVREVLKDALPPTLQLTGLALLINLLLGLAGGILLGLFDRSIPGKLVDGLAIILYAIPLFFLALFFIYLFSIKLHLLPASGMSSLRLAGGSGMSAVADRIKHLLLPATVLGLSGAAVTVRFFGKKLAAVLEQSFILSARARGLGSGRILFVHAMKNALLPVITLVGLQLPVLLSGALIVEVIFAWPGMGRVTYDAIFAKDLPLVMAINLIASVMVIVGNTLADVGYGLADPRIRINKKI